MCDKFFLKIKRSIEKDERYRTPFLSSTEKENIFKSYCNELGKKERFERFKKRFNKIKFYLKKK